MRILLVNNFWGNFGGAEKSTYKTGNILKNKGHEIFFFATNKQPLFEENYKYAKYFPRFMDYNSLTKIEALKYITKPFYNFDAEQRLIRYIKEVKPNIVHCNCIIYYLTSAVLNACYKENIPVVMTLRDPFLSCPNVALMLGAKEYCRSELCVSGNPIHCLVHKCVDISLINSSISVAEFLFRKIHKLYDKVSAFICTSNATLELTSRSGIDRNKLVCINNFLEDSLLNIAPEYSNKGYFLYAGRLAREKGVNYLLHTMSRLPEVKLHIVGTGPEENELKELANKLSLKNVEFLGFKSGEELELEYRNCIASILPSNYFETFGLSIVESFAYGKPVIGSNIGGIPEVIDNGVNGIIFEPANVDELTDAIRKLYKNQELAQEMGKKGKIKAKTQYNSDVYYSKLIDVYESVI